MHTGSGLHAGPIPSALRITGEAPRSRSSRSTHGPTRRSSRSSRPSPPASWSAIAGPGRPAIVTRSSASPRGWPAPGCRQSRSRSRGQQHPQSQGWPSQSQRRRASRTRKTSSEQRRHIVFWKFQRATPSPTMGHPFGEQAGRAAGPRCTWDLARACGISKTALACVHRGDGRRRTGGYQSPHRFVPR